MDAFFSGLDSPLRMSVKVADSIMVGLVNAAMEDAYRKSLWKDGDLERLFQKLRFAELAIMQLEWCVRFVRGEMEGGGAEDDGHEEQLLDELLETRDRIQARLDEGQLAVAEKDRDYDMRRKHEELSSSLRETAAPTDRDGDRAGPGHAEEEGCALDELKGSVDRQMARMRIRLEDARSALAALMQKVSCEASPMARLQVAGHEANGVKGLSGFYSMAQLLMEFQEMVLDAGAVRDSVASSFDVMSRSVSSLRAAMDEQRWLVNAEKEMYGAVIEGFLREINARSPVPKDSSSQPPADNSWEDTESLKDETGLMQSARRVVLGTSDSGQCWHSEEPDISHEDVESLIEEKIDSDVRFDLHGVLYTAMFRDLESKLGLGHEVQRLTEEKDELDMRTKLQYEIYTTVLKDLVNKLAVESVEHVIRTFIKDEIHTVVVSKTLNEWECTTEMVHSERLIKEEIDCVVFGGLAKDLTRDHNLVLLRSPGEITGSNNLGSFSIIDSFEQLQKMKVHINATSEDKGVDSNKHPIPVKQEILGSSGASDSCDGEDSKENDLQAELSTDKVRVSDSVNGNIEQALKQQDQMKRHTGDVALSLSIPPYLENGLVALTLDEKHGTRHSLASNSIIGEHDQLKLQISLIQFTNLQKLFMDFEAVTGDKIGTAMLRLRDLDEQLANLLERVSSLKRSELTYRRAFSRRCHDLQTAETEVDLLGDEVELLLGLLSKTYKALDHYSPVLQHYVGIREILKLIGKELAVKHQVQ